MRERKKTSRGEEVEDEEGGKASLLQCVQVRPSNSRHQVFQPVCVCVVCVCGHKRHNSGVTHDFGGKDMVSTWPSCV